MITEDYFKLQTINTNNNILPYSNNEFSNNQPQYHYSNSYKYISPNISPKTEPQDNIKKSIALKQKKLKENEISNEKIIKNKIFVSNKENQNQLKFKKNRSIHFERPALFNINIDNINVDIISNNISHTEQNFYQQTNLSNPTNINIPIKIIKRSNSDNQINFYISDDNNLKPYINKSLMTEEDKKSLLNKINVSKNMVKNQSPLKNEKLPLDTIRHKNDTKSNIRYCSKKNEKNNKSLSPIQTNSIKFLSKKLDKYDDCIIQENIYNNNYLYISNNNSINVKNNDKKELKSSCLSTNDNTNSMEYFQKLESLNSGKIKDYNKSILTLSRKESNENENNNIFNKEILINKEANYSNDENENKKKDEREKVKESRDNKLKLENNKNDNQEELKQNNNAIELINDSKNKNNYIHSSVNIELKDRPKIETYNEISKDKETTLSRKIVNVTKKKIIRRNGIKKPNENEKVPKEIHNQIKISKIIEKPNQVKKIRPDKKSDTSNIMEKNSFINNGEKIIIVAKKNRKNNSTGKNISKIAKIENKIFNNNKDKDVKRKKIFSPKLSPKKKPNVLMQRKNVKKIKFLNEYNYNNSPIIKNDEMNIFTINNNNNYQCILLPKRENFKEDLPYNKKIIIKKNFDTSIINNDFKKTIKAKSNHGSLKNIINNDTIKRKTHYKPKNKNLSHDKNNNIDFKKSCSNIDINNEIFNEVRDEFSSTEQQDPSINLENKLSSHILTTSKLKKTNDILLRSYIFKGNTNSKENTNDQKKTSVQEYNEDLINKIQKSEFEIQRLQNLIEEMRNNMKNYDDDIRKTDQWIEKEEIEGDKLRNLINFLITKK